MDILTPRGQKTREDEAVVARAIESLLGVRYVETDKDSPAAIDALLMNSAGDKVIAVVETKCRYDVTLEEFRERYDNKWLVTWEKLAKGMEIASMMHVPFVGLLYLPRSAAALLIRISHPNGNLAASMRLETTTTQATVNGGKASRTNAFIDMSTAKGYAVA